MAGTDAIRDGNYVPVSLGVSSADTTVTLPFKINSSSGGLIIDTSTGGVVSSVNTLTGAITLAGGTGITVTPSGNTLTFSLTAGGEVTSITGTANQITASAAIGAVTLSLPSAVILPGSLQVTGNEIFTTDNLYDIGASGATRPRSLYLGTDAYLGGKIKNYSSVATTGWGVPAIYGYVRPAQQVNTLVTLATYTVGAADGSFMVSANINVTVATASLIGVSCTYTDESNTSRVLVLNFSNIAGVFAVTTTLNTAGAFEGVPLHIRAKTGTTITLATTGTVTTATYTAEGIITQIA